MHAAGGRVDHAWQLVGVGGLQLGQAPVFQQHLRQRVVLRQLGQHFLVGRGGAARGLAHDRQPHAAEQDLAQLLGRVQVERLAGQLVGALLQRQHFLAQLVALAPQLLGIDLHAVALDHGQHARDLQLQQVGALQPFVLGHARAQHLVQLQREIGILAGIMPRQGDRHLVETDLLGALAAQVFVVHAAAPEKPLGQVVQAHAAMRLQHIGLQHRVLGHARQAHSFVGEDMGIVFGMVQQLGAPGVLQPAAQARDDLVPGQLIARLGATVRHRDVAGHARLDRHRQAHQPRLHLVERRGFRIQRHQRRVLHQRHPGIEGGPVGDDAVVQLGRRDGLRHGARVPRGQALLVARQFAQPGAKTVAVEQRGQCGRVALAPCQVFPIRHMAGQVAVALDRQQRARERKVRNGFAQIVAGHALDAVGGGHQRVDGAMFGQPLDGRLGSDLVHAGHIVDRVADQHQVIDDALRRHAELVVHPGNVEHLAAHGVDQRDVRVDQLRQVLVARGDDGVDALRAGLPRQRADDVVRLHPFDGQQRPAQGAYGLVDRLDLRRQVFGHGRAVRLVVREQIVPECFSACIENAYGILCLMILNELAQHIDHAIKRTRGFALRIAQVGHGVESTVQVARTVYQQ